MANNSRQPNTTLALFSPSECIAWLTVFGLEAVAMVTLNARNYYLPERTQSSEARHVLGDQPGSCRYVCKVAT